MKFFSGFCFSGEMELFASFANLNHLYSLSGFSYGGILAFKKALELVHSKQRVQTLNLFSPAFFQNQKESFKKIQILGFRKDPQSYIANFLNLCGNPPQKFFKQGTLEELEELLFFKWKEEDLKFLTHHGVQINVFVGGRDQIISPQEVSEFFSPYGVVYFYKHLNHCLQCDHL